VIRVILSISYDVIRQNPGHVVLEFDDQIDKAIEETGRQAQVAVISQHGGFAEETGAEGHARRVELRQVELDHVVLPDQFGGDQAEGRGDNALADAHRYRHADDAHAIHHFFARQGLVVLRRHHRDLVTAPGKGACQPFGVDGQAGGVGTVVSEDGEDFHKRSVVSDQ